MKNLINYYYNLLVTEFRKVDNKFNFEINNIKYSFIPFEGDSNRLHYIYSLLKFSNKYCHEIIFNKDNSISTFYDGKTYILVKKIWCSHCLVSFDDIISYDTLVYDKYEFNWKELWENKIDYYEYQINQVGFKYKKLTESFSYYLGLSETAISLLNFVNKSTIKSSICHKRLHFKEVLDDFFNPTNIVIDNKTRDIAEFIKTNFINDAISIKDVISIINKINLSYEESILLLSRLLYPTYYFDVYDKIIRGEISEDKINFYIKKSAYYEDFLKSIYRYLKEKYKIPEIEWLYFK